MDTLYVRISIRYLTVHQPFFDSHESRRRISSNGSPVFFLFWQKRKSLQMKKSRSIGEIQLTFLFIKSPTKSTNETSKLDVAKFNLLRCN